MSAIHRIDTGTAVPTLGAAAEAFLAEVANPNTARAYRSALAALADRFGTHRPVSVLEGEQIPDSVADWFTATWGTAAPATFNARLGALASAAAWWRDQGWLSGDPLVRIRRLPRTPDHTRALDRAEVERPLTREGVALRERTLWRLLYESAARAEEVLALDVEELDLRNRRVRVRRKGGAADVITWRTATARLLPRLLVGRSSGPVFTTDRRARVEVPPKDIDAGSGRARLSYRRAAELFSTAAGGATLHQLRHSALTHAAEEGANTSTLLAYSGHTSVASLARYARVSPEGLARWQAGRDPARRS
ncbi:site-specific integrase [Nocardiopsis sp. CC223A]|uniref:tyrosine-type recombinase/integrase n=1 Tax=Nocardiopsis sp. CC223A TaxID=3044051 RepID=UPI00278C01B7|nr:site-specific integrase [Nocardiopsis sp. CC223A]